MKYPDYPKSMTHPAHAPAIIGPREVDRYGRVTYGQSIAERYPLISVENPDQEEEARARGYLVYGEGRPAPPPHFEYPKMLAHPDHVDAIPDQIDAKREDDGRVTTWVVKGNAEKFPHVTVNNEAEEKAWAGKGYMPMGVSDHDASEAATAVPHVPGRVHNEYPRWEKSATGEDVLVTDPNAGVSGLAQYPKYIAELDKVADSAEHEAKLLGRPWPPPKAGNIPAAPAPEGLSADEIVRQAQEQAAAIIAAAQAQAAQMQADAAETKPSKREGAGKRAWETRQKRAAEKLAQLSQELPAEE